MYRIPTILFVLLAIALPAFGQCPNGQCAPAPGYKIAPGVYPLQAYQPPQPVPTWYEGDEAGWVELWLRGEKLGKLNPITADWQGGSRPAVNLSKAFGLIKEAKKPPVTKANPKGCICKPGECECDECPDGCIALAFAEPAKTSEPAPLFGMEWHGHGEERSTINGVEVSKPRMIQALSGRAGGASDIPDDSKLARLTVIGSDAKRSLVLADFAKLGTWQGKVIAEGYSPSGPDSWATSRLYPMPVDPTIYLTDADGKVRSCTPGYTEGPAGLERALAMADKLRDPAPGVDPSKAPDLSKPAPTPAPVKPDQPGPAPAGPSLHIDLNAIMPYAMLAGLGVVIFLIARKK